MLKQIQRETLFAVGNIPNVIVVSGIQVRVKIKIVVEYMEVRSVRKWAIGIYRNGQRKEEFFFQGIIIAKKQQALGVDNVMIAKYSCSGVYKQQKAAYTGSEQ